MRVSAVAVVLFMVGVVLVIDGKHTTGKEYIEVNAIAPNGTLNFCQYKTSFSTPSNCFNNDDDAVAVGKNVFAPTGELCAPLIDQRVIPDTIAPLTLHVTSLAPVFKKKRHFDYDPYPHNKKTTALAAAHVGEGTEDYKDWVRTPGLSYRLDFFNPRTTCVPIYAWEGLHRYCFNSFGYADGSTITTPALQNEPVPFLCQYGQIVKNGGSFYFPTSPQNPHVASARISGATSNFYSNGTGCATTLLGVDGYCALNNQTTLQSLQHLISSEPGYPTFSNLAYSPIPGTNNIFQPSDFEFLSNNLNALFMLVQSFAQMRAYAVSYQDEIFENEFFAEIVGSFFIDVYEFNEGGIIPPGESGPSAANEVAIFGADYLFLPGNNIFSPACKSMFKYGGGVYTGTMGNIHDQKIDEIYLFRDYLVLAYRSALVELNQTITSIPIPLVVQYLELTFQLPRDTLSQDGSTCNVAPYPLHQLFKPIRPIFYQFMFQAPSDTSFIGEWNWNPPSEMTVVQQENFWFPYPGQSALLRINEGYQTSSTPLEPSPVAFLNDFEPFVNSKRTDNAPSGEERQWSSVMQFFCSKEKLFVQDPSKKRSQDLEEHDLPGLDHDYSSRPVRGAKSGVDTIFQGTFVRCPVADSFTVSAQVITPPPIWDYLLSFYRYALGSGNTERFVVPVGHNCMLFLKGFDGPISLPPAWCATNPSFNLNYLPRENPDPIQAHMQPISAFQKHHSNVDIPTDHYHSGIYYRSDSQTIFTLQQALASLN